jgi:DNA-binding NarL/FixJ family response regulator
MIIDWITRFRWLYSLGLGTMNMDGSRSGQPLGGATPDQISVDQHGPPDSVNVVLAAHGDSLRAALRARLEQHGGFVVAAEKTNATQALGATLFHSPRVCLLGIDLPGELDSRITSMRAERPETRIGILAHSADQPGLLRAVLAGADGVLLTSDPPETFIAELRALARGERVIPREGSEAPRDDSPDFEREAPADPLDELEPLAGSEAIPELVAAAPRDSWLKATVLYLPRFVRHLRRRLRADMPLPIAWSSARERMWDYR